ncbi:prenylated flavin chaperone LpdD [Lacticaseibacillus mingshuiensis]|uniref:Prenylated flavin chaperone LpdD-like domain-containing protein n=1 Tax=Lacticaseibacillus mingshuiensis TaxID=2799574 RepID=A0ABW4CFK7_9LACO|nr:hypothetical protein [Lacticaseibacillus mingshuiensis]
MTESITFEATQAGYAIQMIVERQSQDLLIQLIGGDVPHYGVVTTIDRFKQIQTTALPSRPGHHHQEGVLTQRVATLIAPVIQRNAVIVCGVHVNSITTVQMAAASEMTKQLAEQLRDWLIAHPVKKPVETYAVGQQTSGTTRSHT